MPQHTANFPHPAPAILPPAHKPELPRYVCGDGVSHWLLVVTADRMPHCPACEGGALLMTCRSDSGTDEMWSCVADDHPACESCDSDLPLDGIRILRRKRIGSDRWTVWHGYCSAECVEMLEDLGSELDDDELQAIASMFARERCDARGGA